MRVSFRLLGALTAAALAIHPALAGGNANFQIGHRIPNDDEIEGLDLDVLERQLATGVTVEFQPGELPFAWAIGLYRSNREEGEDFGFTSLDVEATFTELSFGVQGKWRSESAHAYLGGGLTYMEGELELTVGTQSDKEDDKSPALYAEGGLFWRVGNAFNVGLGGRIVSGTDLELDDVDLEGDYIQTGLILGWGWDSR